MRISKIYLVGIILLSGITTQAQFVTTWKTDNPGFSGDNQITIPTRNGETYAYDIYWEEVGVPTNNGTEPLGQTGNYTITFPSVGTYRVEITGTFPRIYFNAGGFFGDDTDYEKILTIEAWGANAWTSMSRAFSGCINLRVNAIDAPDLTGVTDMSDMFKECEALNDDISSWSVSSITNMAGVFMDAKSFNQPLNAWDVSSVTTMTELFRNADTFNQPLDNWDVRAVTDMSDLFLNALSFNGDIGNWEVDIVTNMSSMFAGADSFNQDISYKLGGGNFGGDAWNTSNVLGMGQMFAGADSFNQDISNWLTSSVTNITTMFSGASAFNQNISSWDISGVSSLVGVFSNAIAFNQDLSAWSSAVGGITNMSSLFAGATAFNQDLSAWNAAVGGTTNMTSMFEGATAFNQDLSGWDVSNVARMSSMFANTTYNQDITGWSVANVSFFSSMFENNTAFDQDITGWTVISATRMSSMFSGATSFNQNLGGWNVSSVTNFSSMLNNSGLSIENYDNLLNGWATLTLQPNMNFGAVGLSYCSGKPARDILTSAANNWFINDAGQGCMAVFKGNNTAGREISNGQIEPVDFGSGAFGSGKTQNFTIENRLLVDLTNIVFSISGSAFSTLSAPQLIVAGTPFTFGVDLSGAAVGSFTETLTITGDNLPDPFIFTITGVITATAEPEIAVFAGSTVEGSVILDGDVSGFNIGNQLRGTDAVNQITITNKGSQVLVVSGLSVSGTNFSLSTTLPFTLPVDGTQTITITLDGTVAGSFSETLTINSDDVDEAVFDFLIIGGILGPDIAVFNGPDRFISPQIINGQFLPVNYGNALQGTDIVKSITFANFGPVDLLISNISITGTAYSISASPPLLIPKEVDGVVSTVTYNVTLSGTTIGVFNETLTITSDDDSKSVFTFNITGQITDPAASIPYMYWSDGAEINRSELDGTAFEQYHTEPTYAPLGIAIDSINSTVYWTNNWGQIRKGDIDATGFINITDFINDGVDINREMGGISLDVSSGKIYWASTYDGEIKSADLFSASPITTVQTVVTGLKNPISVVVDPGKGVLFYTENDNGGGGLDNTATLKKINVDGTPADVAIIWTETIAGEQFTYRDVKLDIKNGKIFWSSGGEDDFNPIGVIYSASLIDVTNTISSFSTTNSNPIGFDLDLKNGKIYWVDNFIYMTPPVIARANLDGSVMEILHDGTTNPSQPSFITLGAALSPTACISPPTSNAGIDQTVCESSTSTMAATIGGGASTILWSSSGDGTFDDNTSLTAIYTPGTADITAGTVSLTLTTDDPDGPGPCIAATDITIITITPAPTANAGTDQTICEADITTLNGSISGGATTVTWSTSGDGSFDDNTSLIAIYTPGTNDISNGTATLTLTTNDPDGTGPCVPATDDIIISIEATPTVDAGVDQEVCPTDVVSLSGVLGGSATLATWTTTGDGTFDDASLLAATYTPGANDLINVTTNLTLTTTAGIACPSVLDFLILSISQPINVINQSGALDVGTTIKLDVTLGGTFNATDNLTTTLLGQPTKGIANINADGSIDYTPSANTVGADSFDFEVCNQCGLCSSATVDITINNVPPAVSIPPSSIQAGGVAVIDILSGITDNNGNLDLSSLKIISPPDPSGAPAILDLNDFLNVDYSNIKFAGTDQVGLEICDFVGLCSQFVVIIEVAPPGVVVYNAVSPNGDNKHDFLEIEGAEFFPDNRIKIMNRWGEIVYEIKGYDNVNNRFDGINNGGGELPSGTYYYIISLGDGSEDINGFFTLRR